MSDMNGMIRLVSAVVIGLAVAAGPANAATITWDGGGDGSSWNVGANWDSDEVPTSSDAVRILIADDVVMNMTQANYTIASLLVNGDVAGSLTIDGGKELTVTGDFNWA